MSIDEELEEGDLKYILTEFKIKEYNADELFKDIDKDILSQKTMPSSRY
ncbi:MAG: hypothetical protein J4473_04815 [Candidatus Aenigmarchaeota archaeon]|nr:hypothetical protein [Candidatus Aenigmarchaeota archaeon]